MQTAQILYWIGNITYITVVHVGPLAGINRCP